MMGLSNHFSEQFLSFNKIQKKFCFRTKVEIAIKHGHMLVCLPFYMYLSETFDESTIQDEKKVNIY